MFGPNAEDIHPNSKDRTVNEIAIIHEYGIGVPRRSFLRRAIQWRNKREVLGVIAQVSRKVLFQGFTRIEAMADAGRWGVKKVLEVLDEGEGPPPQIADATMTKKGHGHALYETGALREAVDFIVVSGDKIVDDGGDE
jgi:hypothetical protein